MSVKKLRVSGMHCASCEGRVADALNAISGVVVKSVSAKASVVHVEVPDTVVDETLAYVLQRAGYPIAHSSFAHALGMSVAFLKRVYPLLLMLLATFLFAFVKNFEPAFSLMDWHEVMYDFMGGFFLLFGGLKVVNLKNFVAMYQGYDLAAQRWVGWGYLYPFLEVALGVLYIARFGLTLANLGTVLLMGFGMIGIYRKLRGEGEVQCACLGGFFNVPVTWLTFGENGLMVVMALYMLLVY